MLGVTFANNLSKLSDNCRKLARVCGKLFNNFWLLDMIVPSRIFLIFYYSQTPWNSRKSQDSDNKTKHHNPPTLLRRYLWTNFFLLNLFLSSHSQLNSFSSFWSSQQNIKLHFKNFSALPLVITIIFPHSCPSVLLLSFFCPFVTFIEFPN